MAREIYNSPFGSKLFVTEKTPLYAKPTQSSTIRKYLDKDERHKIFGTYQSEDGIYYQTNNGYVRQDNKVYMADQDQFSNNEVAGVFETSNLINIGVVTVLGMVFIKSLGFIRKKVF